jgi:hypothetical protein
MTDTTSISIDAFVGSQQTEIFAIDILDRIAELSPLIAAAMADNNETRAEDLTAERDELTAFRDEVEQTTGVDFSNARIVPADLFTDHIRGEAEEAGMVDADLAGYVDWTRLAQHCKQDYKPLTFGDDEVWVR